MVKATASLMILLGAFPAFAAPVTLSQKDVAELILKQGAKTKEVTFKYEQTRADLLKAYSVTDWKLAVESGYENDRTKSLTNLTDAKYERYITTASIGKSLLTGTALTLSASRTSQKTDLVSTTVPPQLDADGYGFTIEQALLGPLTQGDLTLNRATIRAAEDTYEASLNQRADELENVVLAALRQFWNTYVAQENFREALASRDRYENLVAAVRRKTSLGYANPGELSQVQAEYEGRVQAVKTSSLDYLTSLDSLLTLLSLPPGTEIVFSVPKELPPVPKLAVKDPEDLRMIRSQKLKVEAAKENVTAAKDKDHPTLSLVGRANGTGVDETTEASSSALFSGNYNKYYGGLKLTYNFGSGSPAEDLRAKRAAQSLEETVLQRTRDEQRDLAVSSERKAGSTYAVAVSAARQKEFREKAVQELTRTYNQGRTDIRNLILAMNDLFTTEVSVIRALGDYQIALNEWAAARDELIPDQKEEKP